MYSFLIFHCHYYMRLPDFPVQDKMVREFILTNLVERDNSYTWRINLDSIEQNYNKLVGFPDFSTCFQGDTLFLGGANSDYIRLVLWTSYKRLYFYCGGIIKPEEDCILCWSCGSLIIAYFAHPQSLH